MPNWNPNFPEVLGNEWLANIGHTGRVWAGAPALMARLQSTATETIILLGMSATVDPLRDASAPTLIDIIEEGNEVVPVFSRAALVPNADKSNDGWVTDTGSSTSLFAAVDEDATRWPGPALDTYIQTTSPTKVYTCSVNATQFAGGGAQQNARIGWVSVQAILGANTGFRKMSVKLDLNGTISDPAGGGTVDVHGYGALYTFWWGELNPVTGLPWLPADIANFGSAGTYRIRVRSGLAATTAHFPKVFALSLHVHYVTTENRVAVGVWRRPEELTSRLQNISTTNLRTVPGGAANWAKATAKNYLFYWRQSVSPSEYGATVADDVRWNMSYQDLGPAGQPAGIAFAPGGILATRRIAHDQFGRPAEAFPGTAAAPSIGSAAGIALLRSDVTTSVDSQPYRLDVTDIEFVTSTQKLGQRVTPASAQAYIGVRFPIIPPASGTPTLTVAVHRVSDGVQMGGTFTITAAAARALPAAVGGWRYVTGFLSSGASLASGIAYEIRFTSTAGGSWSMAMPDSSLGVTASFGGSTNGAFIGATHFTDRDLSVNLTRQPDPPTGFTATIVNIPITSYVPAGATTVQHVNLAWTLPAVGMGSLFSRYEIERQLDASGIWKRIANVINSAVVSHRNHEVPRLTPAQYRIRAVGTDGRFSNWATSGTVTPVTTGPLVILTCDHDRTLETVYHHDRETSYPVLSVDRDELVAIHGADYQVAFMEAEDRGIGWRTKITISQIDGTGKGGQHKLTQLLALLRSTAIPYVCVMDERGTQILGHVKITDATQIQPMHRYTATLEVTPTHSDPEPVTVT